MPRFLEGGSKDIEQENESVEPCWRSKRRRRRWHGGSHDEHQHHEKPNVKAFWQRNMSWVVDEDEGKVEVPTTSHGPPVAASSGSRRISAEEILTAMLQEKRERELSIENAFSQPEKCVSPQSEFDLFGEMYHVASIPVCEQPCEENQKSCFWDDESTLVDEEQKCVKQPLKQDTLVSQKEYSPSFSKNMITSTSSVPERLLNCRRRRRQCKPKDAISRATSITSCNMSPHSAEDHDFELSAPPNRAVKKRRLEEAAARNTVRKVLLAKVREVRRTGSLLDVVSPMSVRAICRAAPVLNRQSVRSSLVYLVQAGIAVRSMQGHYIHRSGALRHVSPVSQGAGRRQESIDLSSDKVIPFQDRLPSQMRRRHKRN